MAIYHFRLKKGKKSISHLEYIMREGKYHRDDLLTSESFNIPKEFKDVKDFWESAILYERANANIYREYEISLPKELNFETNKKILDSFLKKQFGKNYVYNYAIHSPHSSEGGEQPHAHIMFCERILDDIPRTKEKFFKRYNAKNPELGGAKKNRMMQQKEFLIGVRKEWENHLNKFLDAYGIEKVSCETLKKQRDEALIEGDLVKAELLNRKPVADILNSKIKKNELNDEEKEEIKYRKNEKKLKQKIDEKIKLDNLKDKYKKEKEKKKEKTFKEILDEKEKLESEIFKLYKKLDPKRLTENAYGILSKGEISKLKNEKRSLFKKIKNTKDKLEKQKLKNKIKNIDKQIETIKSLFDEETVLNKELELRKKYMKALKYLNEKLIITNNIFLEKLKQIDENDYESLKYYQAYLQRKDLREEKENLQKDLKRNKAKIKKDVAIKFYKSAFNTKKINFDLRKKIKICDSILKKIERDQKINEKNIQYGEFTLDDYRYSTLEGYLDSLDKE